MARTGANDITVNDVFAFLVEVAALLSLSAWGFHTGSGPWAHRATSTA
jgi:hypothetical protein